MPFDGSGNYTPLSSPNFPAITGQVIVAGYYNAVINDLATALDNCLTRDGQGKPSTSINWNGQRIINLANGVNPADAVNLSQLSGYALLSGAPTFAGLITGNAGFSGTTLALSGSATITGLFVNGNITAYNVGVSSARIGQVGYHMYNNGSVVEWIIYQPAHATDDSFHIATGNTGVLTDQLTITPTGLATMNGGIASTGALALTGALVTGILANSVGYLGIPQATVHVANYQFALADQSIDQAFNGTNLVATIPANASVAFPIGAVLIGTNLNASSMTVAITTDTLIWSGTTTTGTRTIGQNGEFRARKITATSWLITGTAMA